MLQGFSNWFQKMKNKSEIEQHRFALTFSLFIGSVVLFFVVSGWYFRISGESINSSFFTDLEDAYNSSKNFFSSSTDSFQNFRTNLPSFLPQSTESN